MNELESYSLIALILFILPLLISTFHGSTNFKFISHDHIDRYYIILSLVHLISIFCLVILTFGFWVEMENMDVAPYQNLRKDDALNVFIGITIISSLLFIDHIRKRSKFQEEISKIKLVKFDIEGNENKEPVK